MPEKILVVDDDLDTLRLVGLMLERQGYQIIAASNGSQALALAKSEKPDLILLDLMMPDMDGVEVARQLRSDPLTQDILMIMFTARGQVENKLEGFEAGADDYLTKPTQPRELIAHVKAVLKRGKRLPAALPRGPLVRGSVIGAMAVKGGVGVSTLALNLGITLHSRYKKDVIVSDFRPGCGSIGLELGYTVNQGLNRFLTCDPSAIDLQSVESELVSHPSGVRFLLSTPKPMDAKLSTAPENYVALAKQLSYLARYIVLDLGNVFTEVNEKVLEQCDQLIVVLEPVAQTILQTRSLVEYLTGKGVDDKRLLLALVNRMRAGVQLSLSQVQDHLGRNVSAIFTAVPELAYQALVSNTPMVLRQPDGVTTQQFHTLAEKVFQRVG